jgi:hypothetical protein
MLHNLFYTLPLFDILLYLLVLLQFIFPFSFLSLDVFRSLLFLEPSYQAHLSSFYSIIEWFSFVYIQMNSITEIRIAVLNFIGFSGLITDRMWLKEERNMIRYFKIMNHILGEYFHITRSRLNYIIISI